MEKNRAKILIFTTFNLLYFVNVYAYVFGPVTDRIIINQEQYRFFFECQIDGRLIRDALELNLMVPGAPQNPITDKNVSFLLFTQRNPKIPQILRVGDSKKTILSTNINFSKETVLYVAGLKQTFVTSARKFTTILLPTEDINIIITNWNSYAFFSFMYSRFITTPLLGNIVGEFLQTLITAGADPKKMHLVGFSTGGQAIGIAAKEIQPKVARITAYDAQGSCFNFLPPNQRLSKGDADYVQIIHCTIGDHAVPLSITGDVTFYMNGGLIQPQCANLMTIRSLNDCSHSSCETYLYQSLRKKSPLVGIKCDSYLDYLFNQCDCKNRVSLTYNVSTSVTGLYFVDTTPFKKVCDL